MDEQNSKALNTAKVEDRTQKLIGLRPVGKSIFSRFCQCGGNVTVGLVSIDGYVATEQKWTDEHRGIGHADVTRREWLAAKLGRAA